MQRARGVFLPGLLAIALVLPATSFAITTTGNPNDPMYTGNPGGFYNGVALLSIFSNFGLSSCSGALIDPVHVLTAAHCVAPVVAGTISEIDVQFEAGTTYTASSWIFDPLFNIHNVNAGNDLGIITLTSVAAGITPYALYVGQGLGATVDIAGFGATGQGGENLAFDPETFRHGQNQYDSAFNSAGNPVSNPALVATYQFDADFGDTANDVSTCEGDSGGPSFINGALAGVHSFGDFRCSQFGADDAVSQSGNLAFIQSHSTASVATAPEPSSFLMLGSALATAPFLRRRRK